MSSSKPVTSLNRYHTLAILLHWLMALGFVFMVGSGCYMVNGDMTKAAQFDLYQIHKASGVLMLWAIALRLLVRWLTTPPHLPVDIPARQQRLSRWGHGVLYAGLVVIPLAGWFMVSASPYGLPTFVFTDAIRWPHIPGVERNKTVAAIAEAVHWYTVVVILGALAGHIGAVVLHRVKHKVSLLRRMWWSF